MQLSVLRDQTRYLTSTTSGNYSDNDLNVNLTRAAHLLATEIMDAMGNWDFQGDIATANLVANQREYPFPSDLLVIKRIEIYLSNEWRVATLFDVSECSYKISTEADITEHFTNEAPYVDLHDDSLFFYSGTIAEKIAGIKIWYTREIVGKDSNGTVIASFTADADTPNIAEAFQRGLIYSAALDFFTKFGMGPDGDRMEAKLEKVIARMKIFYNRRAHDEKVVIKSAMSFEDYQ